MNIEKTAAHFDLTGKVALVTGGTRGLGLAHSFGPGFRCNCNCNCNCIMPGPFLTDISNAWNMAAMNEMFDQLIPMKRAGQA